MYGPLMHAKPSPIALFRFVLRCILAAEGAYLVALELQLPHMIWAPVSALIVMQDSVRDTRNSVYARLLGTLIGILVAVAVYELSLLIKINMGMQLAIVIAITAVCAKKWPPIRVCLWTSVMVLMGGSLEQDVPQGAFDRGVGVALGAVVGSLVHRLDEFLFKSVTIQEEN